MGERKGLVKCSERGFGVSAVGRRAVLDLSRGFIIRHSGCRTGYNILGSSRLRTALCQPTASMWVQHGPNEPMAALSHR